MDYCGFVKSNEIFTLFKTKSISLPGIVGFFGYHMDRKRDDPAL